MNFVFDIDGTLCTNTEGEYSNAKPFVDRINRVNELFDQGNRIILSTARGMGSSNNDIESARDKWEKFTIDQLAQWGVRYHMLFLGKPSGDLYIDDKAIKDLDFFQLNPKDL